MTFRFSRPAPAKATLVVSENFYPGWAATGRPTNADGRADYTLMVPLPEGALSVDLVFRDPTLPLGTWITCAALLVSLAWLGVALVRDRRKG